MRNNVHWLGVLCVLLSIIQIALMQGEDSESEEGCGKLSGQSLQVTCSSPEGPTPCNGARVGSVARVTWKKNVVPKGTKGGYAPLECVSPGVWKKSKKRQGGNSGGDRVDDYITLPDFGAYKFYNQKTNWDAANETCKRDGAKILIVDSLAEINALYATIPDLAANLVKSNGLPLGVRLDSQRKFRTDYGELFPIPSSVNWGSGDPSMLAGENCVFIRIPANTIHDVVCEIYSSGFICERPLN